MACSRFFGVSEEAAFLLSAPAPGYRNRDSGTLCYVGSDGASWSSSVDGGNARYLGFYHSWLGPQYSYSRAYGFPVRCLQE